MAMTGLLALIDDVATLLDDVAILTKVAAKKTAGVLGDDLALNAEQVTGVKADRELPVVWSVAKGSLLNKLILVPLALAISAVISWLITPLMLLGGLFLCFEGAEKVIHKLSQKTDSEKGAHASKLKAVADPNVDLVAFERQKIKGAIRTDFILSAEIIVITLGTVKDETLLMQSIVVATIALVVTLGVYALVAAIVKLDDLGLKLLQSDVKTAARQILGKGILKTAPVLMKVLGVAGTIAMFLVGGGIIVHSISVLHHLQLELGGLFLEVFSLPYFLFETLMVGVVGILCGITLVAIIHVSPWPHKEAH